MGRPRKYKATRSAVRQMPQASKNIITYKNRRKIQQRRKCQRLTRLDSTRQTSDPLLHQNPMTRSFHRWNEQVAERKALQMDRFRLERKFTKITGNLGQRVLPELIRMALKKSQVKKSVELFASVLHDVQELSKEVDALEGQMDRAFAGGPDAKACMNLLHRTFDLDKDLMNAMAHCSHGLDNLCTVQSEGKMRYQNH
ncbi:hypothetical protein C8J56DRAFT_976022 [Mycena floridula]|nr:hypothetical protein C8J56DRAFT_976022 [Mycena floridula]